MKRIKLLAAVMLAFGLIAIAAGGAFYMSGATAVRPEKSFEDYMRDADLYADNGEYYKAVVSYESALEEAPDDMDALLGLASVYGRQSNYRKETEVRERIAGLFPDDLDNQIRLVEIMIHEGSLDEARQKTEELMKEHDSEALKSLYRDMDIDTPAFNLASGSYDDYQILQLTNPYSNAVVYYTTDGSEPTAASSVYSDGIVISYPETVIRARAIGALGYESGEVQLNFTVTKPVEELSTRNSDTLYRIGNKFFKKSWNSPLYNYELAQIRDLYLLGSYNVDTEDSSAVFYEGYYTQHGSRQTERGDFDLSFAAYTPFLRTLSVGYQNQLDLSPLASLRYIENLSLINDGITDITPLAGLTSLKRLALGWNNITDASPLAGLTGLESLGLWNNQISDVSMLGGLTGLTYFDVAHNQVSQIDCVSRMTGLTEVWIDHNQIRDLSPLDACEKMVILMQGGNPVSNYGSVKDMAGQLYKNDLEW